MAPNECPACGCSTIREEHNSYSRYCDAYICINCGRREAFEQFFWRDRAIDRRVNLNDE
jgi:hypothetical protein